MSPVRAATREDYEQRMLRVLVHVQEHLDDDLPLETLARVAGFSPFHFHRIFRGMVGETVARHVRRLRLERAASRLRLTAAPVTSIALDAGYESHEAFTRAFRAAFDRSPSQWRAEAGRAGELDAPSGVHWADGRLPDTIEPVRDGGRSPDVEVRTAAPIRAAFMRHVGPYDQVGDTWARFMARAGGLGLLGPFMRPFGLSYDDPAVTDPQRLRYDACLAAGEPFEGAGDVGVQTVRGGRYAVVIHAGPYERFPETYEWLLGRWFPNSGHLPADGPCLELYLNDPTRTAAGDLRTEVRVGIDGS